MLPHLAAAPSPSNPCPPHGVEGLCSLGEHGEGWKRGEAGGFFLPLGRNGSLASKCEMAEGKVGKEALAACKLAAGLLN